MKVQEQIKEYITSQPEPKRSDMQELHGVKVRLKVVGPEKLGLFGRFRKFSSATPFDGAGLAFASDLVSAIETRALWSRFGL